MGNSNISIAQPGHLSHFDYATLDQNCTCPICIDWRTKLAAYQNQSAMVSSHKLSCMCLGCKQMRTVRSSYHAALNRRDLFCEMSWLMSTKSYGADLMDWLVLEFRRQDLSDGWWEKRMPYYPMYYWIGRFTRSTGVSGVISLAMAVSGMAAEETFAIGA